jgi:hypothetical protein
MKTIIAALVAIALLWTGNVATAQTLGFSGSNVHSRVQALDARVQAIQLQQQAKLARQVQFIQQQQLVAANAVNVHSQLAQLRALQQAQNFNALGLNNIYGGVHQSALIAAPGVHHQAAQVVVQQPVVVRQQVVRRQVCQPRLLFRSRCR